MTRCRVCKNEFKGGMGFQSHIMKHKRDFCKVIGRWEGEARKINFEDVILHYNPEEADETKCIGYHKLGMVGQKSLIQFAEQKAKKVIPNSSHS